MTQKAHRAEGNHPLTRTGHWLSEILKKLFKIASPTGRNQQVFSPTIHFFSHENPKPGGIPCRAYIETPVCNAQIYNLSKNPSIEQIDVQFHLKTGLIFPKSFSAEIDCADTFFI